MYFSSHLSENQYFLSRKIDENVVFLATTHDKSGLTRRELQCVVTRSETLSSYHICINKHYVSAPNGRCGRDGIGSTFSASFFDNLRWIVCVRQAGAEINLQMCVVREHNSSRTFVKNNGPGTTLVGQFCSGFPTVWSLRMGSSGSRDHKHVKSGELLLCGFFLSVVLPLPQCTPLGENVRCIIGVSYPSPFRNKIHKGVVFLMPLIFWKILLASEKLKF